MRSREGVYGRRRARRRFRGEPLSGASERYRTCNRPEQIRPVARKTLHRQGKGRQMNPWGWIIVAIAIIAIGIAI
jgi:hypothetical protein